jgi:hypothetical protein
MSGTTGEHEKKVDPAQGFDVREKLSKETKKGRETERQTEGSRACGVDEVRGT